MPIDRRNVVDFMKYNRLQWILQGITRIRKWQEELINDAITISELQRDEIEYIKWDIDLLINQFKRLEIQLWLIEKEVTIMHTDYR